MGKGIERKPPVVLSGYVALGFGSSSMSIFVDRKSEKYRKETSYYPLYLYLVQPPIAPTAYSIYGRARDLRQYNHLSPCLST